MRFEEANHIHLRTLPKISSSVISSYDGSHGCIHIKGQIQNAKLYFAGVYCHHHCHSLSQSLPSLLTSLLCVTACLPTLSVPSSLRLISLDPLGSRSTLFDFWHHLCGQRSHKFDLALNFSFPRNSRFLPSSEIFIVKGSALDCMLQLYKTSSSKTI